MISARLVPFPASIGADKFILNSVSDLKNPESKPNDCCFFASMTSTSNTGIRIIFFEDVCFPLPCRRKVSFGNNCGSWVFLLTSIIVIHAIYLIFFLPVTSPLTLYFENCPDAIDLPALVFVLPALIPVHPFSGSSMRSCQNQVNLREI